MKPFNSPHKTSKEDTTTEAAKKSLPKRLAFSWPFSHQVWERVSNPRLESYFEGPFARVLVTDRSSQIYDRKASA